MNHVAETGNRDNSDAYAAARAADELADRRTAEALTMADTAGDLVTHDFADACSLGVWHAGPCEP